MPLHLVYGASPNDLSRYLARETSHDAHSPDFLARLCASRLGERRLASWIETLQLLKHILGKALPFSSLEHAGRLLLSCKKNLVFTALENRTLRLPELFAKALSPFSLTLKELYAAYQTELLHSGQYDIGDLWQVSYELIVDKQFPFSFTKEPLHWDRTVHLSPGERLWLAALKEAFPDIALTITSPLSFGDEEDPFFSSAFNELGGLADETLSLDRTYAPETSHLHFESCYQMLCELKRLHPDSIRIVDRLPRAEKEVLQRFFDCRPAIIFPQDKLSWAARDDLLYRANANETEHSLFSPSLAQAYTNGADTVAIPYFQADTFPEHSPLSLEELAFEPIEREWNEILNSRLFLYWQDRVLLRLLSTRFEGKLILLSAARDLTGRELAPSPFTETYFQKVGAGFPRPHNQGAETAPLHSLSSSKHTSTFSVAHLELFSQCPFRYWMEVIVGAKSPEITIGIPKALRGTIIHRLLEYTICTPMPFAELWKKVSAEFSESLAPFTFLAQNELRSQAERALTHVQEHRLAATWRTVAVEWRFEWPIDDNPPFVLRGRVDRIIENPATGDFVVIDYKTGSSPLSSQSLLAGEALQLPVYLAAVKALLLPNGRAGGAAYWDLNKGEIKTGIFRNDIDLSAFDLGSRSQGKISPVELDVWQETALVQVKSLVTRLRTSDFAPAPADTGFCKRACAWKRTCGYPWMNMEETLHVAYP